VSDPSNAGHGARPGGSCASDRPAAGSAAEEAAASALEPAPSAVVIVLGDQPRTRVEVIRALVAAARSIDRPGIVPRYGGGGGANPVLLREAAFELVDEASGDRGLGPLLASDPDLVLEVPVGGANPDIDTPDDLRALAEADRARMDVS